LEWFTSHRERHLPVTSPFTNEEMTELLEPNVEMANAISEYRIVRATKALARRTQPEMAHSASMESPVSSLAELGAMFSLLDGLRGLLAETLDGWSPPQIVVVFL